MVSLGNFIAGALSDDGSVMVGGIIDSGPAIWTEDGGAVLLQPLLVHFGLDLSGWHLRQARAISADGNTIAGWGFSPRGIQEAWVATIPEPSSCALVGIALAFVVLTKGFRRHRNRPCRIILAARVEQADTA
jgi:hypothetical protein